MTRPIAICATVVAICFATSNSAHDLPNEKIVSVGENTYMIRVGGKPVDVAIKEAMKRATEYCAGTKQTMIIKYEAFDMVRLQAHLELRSVTASTDQWERSSMSRPVMPVCG